MVTQNATSTEETQVSPNPDTQPLDLSEPTDEPLISPDRVFGPDGVEVGAEPQAEGGAESTEDGAASTEVKPEETDETETSQEPETEVAAETDTETETSEDRTYSREEVQKIQSKLDQQAAEARREAQEARQEAEAARKQIEEINQRQAQQSIDAQVIAYRDEVRQKFESQGYDAQAALEAANAQARAAKAAFDATQRSAQLEAELQELRGSSERTSASALARDMAEKYNVSRDDIQLLAQTSNPEQMETLAKRLGTFNTQLSEQNERLQAEVPTADQDPIDKGGGGPGGMTDDQKIEAFSRGEYNDFAEVQAILNRRGMSPF